MKFFAIALAVTGVASAASLNAQTIPARSGIITGQTAGTRSTDCNYARTSNSVGDIVFGRTELPRCVQPRGRRLVSGWPGTQQQLSVRAPGSRQERQPRDPARTAQSERHLYTSELARRDLERQGVEKGAEGPGKGLSKAAAGRSKGRPQSRSRLQQQSPLN
jgi:hypothetical protein